MRYQVCIGHYSGETNAAEMGEAGGNYDDDTSMSKHVCSENAKSAYWKNRACFGGGIFEI